MIFTGIANKITVVNLTGDNQTVHDSVAVDVLSSFGIDVRAEDEVQMNEIDGLFLDKQMDLADFNKHYAKWRDKKLFLLVYGDQMNSGWAGQLQMRYEAQQLEVVRLLLWDGVKRAFLGGEVDGVWSKKLRQHLALHEIISIMCRPVEVDEIAWGLHSYLAWKQLFFVKLGERCDQTDARLEVISKGLGMDKRVGQGWFVSNQASPVLLEWCKEWLQKQVGHLVEKTNIEQIALWGCPESYIHIIHELFQWKQVRIYSPDIRQNPNVFPNNWLCVDHPVDVLKQADLLIILDNDTTIKEIVLHQLVQQMKQPIVIDTCASYPLQEAEAFAIKYRSFGQNTNVWEWN